MAFTEDQRLLHKKICALTKALDSLTINTSGIEGLLSDIKDSLDNQTEEVNLLLYCDEDCNITGAISYYRGEDDEAVTALYFDADLQSTTTPPTGLPCGVNCQKEDFEFKFFETIKCVADGGETKKVKEILCILYADGIETSTETFWIVDGAKVSVAPTFVRCEEPCDPKVETFNGDAATLKEYDSLEVFVPKCCTVTITTSAGAIELPSMPTKYYYQKDFDCMLTSYSIASTCDVLEIKTILTKTK